MIVYQHGYCDECDGNDCADPNCQLSRQSTPGLLDRPCGDESETTHQHTDGSWWFGETDEDDWCIEGPPRPRAPERGPFGSEEAAKQAANAYLAEKAALHVLGYLERAINLCHDVEGPPFGGNHGANEKWDRELERINEVRAYLVAQLRGPAA